MDDFKRIDFSDTRGGAAAACQRLPNSPAIYAFFAPKPMISTNTAESFLSSVIGVVRHKASPTHTRILGSLHTVRLDNQSDLSDWKRERLEECAQLESFRHVLAEIIAAAVPLRCPLYVGQTDDLSRRIKDHLSPSSDLATRLRSASIQIEACTLAYAVLPESDLYKDTQTLTLIEEIVTRLTRPGFVGRIG
jgi:hypothetical protein